MKTLITVCLTMFLVLGFSSVLAAEKPVLSGNIHSLLKQKIDLDINEMTNLENVLKYISETQKGLNIVIDPELASAGIDLSRRIIVDGLKVKQVSVEWVLDLVLGSDLGYKIEPGAIIIKLRDKSMAAAVVSRAYSDPFARAARLQRGELDELIDIIKKNVNSMADRGVAGWKDEGGPATIIPRGSQLIIAQTERGHERIANLLKSLASVAAGRPPPIMPEPKEITLTRTWLQKKVDVNFEHLSLHQALEQLGGMQPDLNFVIDPDVAACGLDLSTRMVDLRLQQVPIETLLKLMLRKDLAYKVEPGFVLVTTCEGRMRNLPCVVYLVRPPEGKIFEWYQEIKKLVNHNSDPDVAAWGDEGGPAALDLLSCSQLPNPNYALIVTQTPVGQKRVAEMLQKWK